MFKFQNGSETAIGLHAGEGPGLPEKRELSSFKEARFIARAGDDDP